VGLVFAEKMKTEFVGGSKDGGFLEIPPAANYRLLFRCEVEEWPNPPELTEKPYLTEEYEYMMDGKYHFIGYK
jgi:hypothetical protein